MYNSAKKITDFSELKSSLKGSDKVICSYHYREIVPETEIVTYYYYFYDSVSKEYAYIGVDKEIQLSKTITKYNNINYYIPISELNGGKIANYSEKVSNEDGGLNTINLRMDNNTVFTLDIYNGTKGETGRKGYTGDKGDKGPSVSFENGNESNLLKIANDGSVDSDEYALSARFGKELNNKIERINEVFLQEEDYQNLSQREQDTNYFTFEEAGNIKTNKIYNFVEEMNSSEEPTTDPVEPENPDTPTEPENPENPDTPDTPSEPENPDTPDTPDNPDTQIEPENPDTPDTPEEPEISDNTDNIGPGEGNPDDSSASLPEGNGDEY